MIMIQLCIQGNDFKWDLDPPLFEILHQIPFVVFTLLSLICDLTLYRQVLLCLHSRCLDNLVKSLYIFRMIKARTVPDENNLDILVSPDASDPTRIPIRATILSTLAQVPVVLLIGVVYFIPGTKY